MTGSEACLLLWTAPGVILVVMYVWRRIGVERHARRGLDNLSPAEAYQQCHLMLQQMVKQAYYLLPTFDAETQLPLVRWGAYTVSVDGLLYAPDTPTAGLLPITAWDSVSGVGVEMAPLFHYAPATRSFWDISTQVNTGYQFNLLIVPLNGSTLTIRLPLRNNEAAIRFAAHVLAFARYRHRRLSHIGFDKKLTRDVVHLNMF